MPWLRNFPIPDCGLPPHSSASSQSQQTSTSTKQERPKPRVIPPRRVFERLPKPDTAVSVPPVERKPSEKYNPYIGYEQYYKGKHVERTYLESEELYKQALRDWAHPEKALLRDYGKGYYFQNATIDAYHPSLLEKLATKGREIYKKSFFGIMDEKLEQARRQALAEYALSGNTKKLLGTSLMIGLTEPVTNPPKFLYNLARTPITVAHLIRDNLLSRHKDQDSTPKTELQKRLERGAKIMAFGQLLGEAFAGTSLVPYVDYSLAKVRGYWRTRGLPKVEPEKVISKDVLEGRSEFANYPQSMLRAPQTEKIRYLYKVNSPAKKAVAQATGEIDESSRFLGFHATSTEFPPVTEVLPGTSEAPGLYMAPVTSPHFLRIAEPTETSAYVSLRNLFGKPLFMKKPTIIAVQTRGIRRIPNSLEKVMPTKVGDKLFTSFMWKQAGSGETFITWRSAVGLKPEMEVIAAPKSLLLKTSEGAYTTFRGIRVPIRMYKLLPKEGLSEQIVSTARKVKATSPYSLGIESMPYGTYSLVSGAASLGTMVSSQEVSLKRASRTRGRQPSQNPRTSKRYRHSPPRSLALDFYTPQPDYRLSPSSLTESSSSPSPRPPQPSPPKPPKPPKYPPQPSPPKPPTPRHTPPEYTPHDSSSSGPSPTKQSFSPQMKVSHMSQSQYTIRTIPSLTSPPKFRTSAPPKEMRRRKLRKKKVRKSRRTRKVEWKKPVEYSYYLSGFGKAFTIENLSGFGQQRNVQKR